MLLDAPLLLFFFFNDTATTEIYTLSLHDALPIYALGRGAAGARLLAAEALHPVAGDDAGVQRVDVHVVGTDLERHGAGEAAERPLGGRVRRAVLVAAQAGGAADVDDLAVALGDHRRQDVLGRQERPPEVHREHVVPVFALDLPHRRLDGSRDAGSVDQDVDPSAERGEGALDERRHRGLVGDVRGLDERSATDGLDLAADRKSTRLNSSHLVISYAVF